MMEDAEVPEGFRMTEIGPLPEEWTTGSLRKLNIKKKINLNPSDFPDEIFEYYSIPAYQNSGKPLLEKGSNILSQKIVLENGVVLFGKLNPRVEKVWKVQSNSQYRKVGSTEWIPIFPNEDEVDSNYLYYAEWSSYVMPLAKSLVTGSTPSRQRVDPSSFYRIKIPLPHPSEQNQIAFVLSTIQQTIEKTEAVINAAKELKKSMMKHLFTYGHVSVDKAENVVLKETEIGLMPEEWEVVRLGDVLKMTQYGISKRADKKGEYPILRMNNLEYGHIDLSDLKHINLDSEEFKKFRLEKNDILFNRTNSIELVGKTAIFDFSGDFVFASYLIRLGVQKFKIDPYYLNYYLNWGSTQRRLKMLASRGVSQSNINATKLKGFLVPLSTLSVQQEIASTLSTVDQKIQIGQTRKKALEELFKTLLHNLMTGRIRVTHLEVPHD